MECIFCALQLEEFFTFRHSAGSEELNWQVLRKRLLFPVLHQQQPLGINLIIEFVFHIRNMMNGKSVINSVRRQPDTDNGHIVSDVSGSMNYSLVHHKHRINKKTSYSSASTKKYEYLLLCLHFQSKTFIPIESTSFCLPSSDISTTSTPYMSNTLHRNIKYSSSYCHGWVSGGVDVRYTAI